MKIIIAAGGDKPSKELILREMTNGAVIIAADSGANYLYECGIAPHYLVGDLDSIDQQALEFCTANQVIIERYPKEKDFTDAELALQLAIKLKADAITFLGCLGGKRIDHAIGSLGLLIHCLTAKIPAKIVDEAQEVFLLSAAAIISGSPGSTFSLLAYQGSVINLSIIGCKYELHNYTLKVGDVLTLSNEFLDRPVRIEFTGGVVLLVYMGFGLEFVE